MKKRVLAFTLAVLALAGLAAGCGEAQTAAPSQPPASEAAAPAADTPGAAEASSGEPAELDVYIFQWWGGTADIWNNYHEGSEVLAKLEADTGVKLNIVDIQKDQQEVYFVSGDLGDLAQIASPADVQTLKDSKLIMPLNDLVDRFGENIKNSSAPRWDASVNILGDGANAYGLPIKAGNEGTQYQSGRYIYTLRYDHLEELGFPEWTNYYEYLDDVAKLAELHPTTDEGLPTIGVTVAPDSTTSNFNFENRIYGTVGYSSGEVAKINIADGKLTNNYMDDGSCYWQSIDFYRYAYKLGILDPDWAVQSTVEMTEKFDAGRVISSDIYNSGRTTYIESKFQENPEYLGGWVQVPVKGAAIYQNAQQLAGWGSCFWTVPTASRNPEAAIRLLNYTYGYEGGRLVSNGAEGVTWDIGSEGRPLLNQTFYDMPADKGEKRMYYLLAQFRGLSHATILPDGGTMDLTYSPDYYKNAVSEPWIKAYDEHYNVSWPNEQFLAYCKEGYMLDRERLDERITAKMIPDEDMQRVEALCVSTAISYLAKLVEAPTDADFEQAKADMRAELAGYGVDELYAHIEEKYKAACEEYGNAAYLASFPPVQGR